MGFFARYCQMIQHNAPTHDYVDGLADSVIAESGARVNRGCIAGEGCFSAAEEACHYGRAENSRCRVSRHARWPRAAAAMVLVVGIAMLSFVGIGDGFMPEAEAGRYAVTVKGIELVEPETIWFDSSGGFIRISARAKIAMSNPRHEPAQIAFGDGVEVSPTGAERDGGWDATLSLGAHDDELTLWVRVCLPADSADTEALFGSDGQNQDEAVAYAADLFVRHLCDSQSILLVDGEAVAQIRFEEASEGFTGVVAVDEPIDAKRTLEGSL